MGAKCCNSDGTGKKRKHNTCELNEVVEQTMLMDNNEVRVMQIEGQKVHKRSDDAFNGYLQRKSHFVIPQIDKLRKDKLELKQ